MIEFSIYYPIVRDVGKASTDKVKVEFVTPKRPFLFWSDVRMAERIQYPKGYGVAYYDFLRGRALFAPMPFNVLIALGIRLYLWTRWRFARKVSSEVLKNDRA